MQAQGIRQEISHLISSIQPLDTIEEAHKDSCLSWVESGAEIFRLQKPDIPNKHLVSYFCVCDFQQKKVLLVEHKNAGLWLPSGGHVEPGENPKKTVVRECQEELQLDAKFWKEVPLFITQSETVGKTSGHTDVSLWYVLEADSTEEIQFDAEEFHSVSWFDFDKVPFEESDPHMQRFIGKLNRYL